MRADFAELHRSRFGYCDEGAEVIVDALVVEAVAHDRSPHRGTGDRAGWWTALAKTPVAAIGGPAA